VLVTSKEAGLRVSAEKIERPCLMSRMQDKLVTYNIKIVNRYFEIVAKIKYLGRTPTNQNCVIEGIKRR
jgi:hypothetical protein